MDNKTNEFDTEIKTIHNDSKSQKRHAIASIWLIGGIIFNTIVIFIYIFMSNYMIEVNPYLTKLTIILNIIICLVGTIAYIFILMWQRIVFYLYIATVIVSIIISIQTHILRNSIIYGIIGVIIMLLILKLRRNGKNIWENFEELNTKKPL
jgi:hypothetical protein